MPEYLSRGVYVEEVSSGIKPIEGVSTSTAGFVGRTERGPIGARLITSFPDYYRVYGGFLRDDNYLPDAIKGFFDNGGQRVFVSRVVTKEDNFATATIGGLEISAIGPGKWGTNIYAFLVVGTSTPAEGRPSRLRLLIAYSPDEKLINPVAKGDPDPQKPKPTSPDVLEEFDNVTDDASSSDDIATTVNRRSQLVRVTRLQADAKLQPKPASDADKVETTWPQLGGGARTVKEKEAGPTAALSFLDEVDEISLVVAPDNGDIENDGFVAELVTRCERLRDRVVLLSSKSGDQSRDSTPVHNGDSSFGAFYHPWINVANADTKSIKMIPPIGHVAGICARSDVTRGVHKAPANEVVMGALAPPFPLGKGVQSILNPRGVNCIRDFQSAGHGIRVWGARTMSSDPEWKYLNVRRLFLFMEKSIDHGTQWVVFEPNSDPTWAAVRRNITNFLISVWRSGALLGTTAEEAFFVRCDRTTMTEDDLLNGRLICVIGVAPVRPAEFVIFQISQKTSEANT